MKNWWSKFKFLSSFKADLGIDLGTASTHIYLKGAGLVLSEPSMVAVNLRTDQVIAVGIKAKSMWGKTPQNIQVIKPLVDGIVSDFEAAEKMLRYFFDSVKAINKGSLHRPRVVIGIPIEVTEVERKAVEDAAYSAGAREVHLIEEPLAGAFGARINLEDCSGQLVVDFGAGTTEVAVISLNGVVQAKSLRLAGNELNEAIMQFIREEMNLAIGEQVAEDIKCHIGAVVPLDVPAVFLTRGRDVLTGLPREVEINDSQIREAILRPVRYLVEQIRATIEVTPPELVADISSKGILLIGGGSQLLGLPDLLAHELKVPVSVAEDPTTCVVRGCGLVVENLEKYDELLVRTETHRR